MKEENQCVLYPCHEQNNGEIKEVVEAYDSPFVGSKSYVLGNYLLGRMK